jgi:hypothetical protein
MEQLLATQNQLMQAML